MSIERTSATTERLNSIKQRLEEMVARKWTPLREKNGSEPMEVWIDEDSVHVGHVNELWGPLLLADVVRTFDSHHYDIRGRTSPTVCPVSKSEFYAIPEGAAASRAAVLKALDQTGIHVPNIYDYSESTQLRYFETEAEAELAAAALEDPISEAYDGWKTEVTELEVKEWEEPRTWLAPDSWYSVRVHYG